MVRALFALASGALAASCVLFTDLSGFSTGGVDGALADEDVATEASASRDVEAGAEGVVDSGDASVPKAFFDDFARPDGVVGNDWIEKTLGTYLISGGRVVPQPPDLSYRNHLLYRPASEDVLDVEASVEFTNPQLPPGYPQIFVRAQSATVAKADEYDGYILYVPGDPAKAWITRQRGPTNHSQLQSIALAPPLDATNEFRLVLRVRGTDPVELTGIVEKKTGTGFQTLGKTTVVDGDDARIKTAGTVGVSGSGGYKFRYDNFTRTPL
jgi:hypothetical protein